MLEEKFKFVVETLGNKNITVKADTPLAYVFEEAVIGHGERFNEVCTLVSNTLISEINMFRLNILPEIEETSDLLNNRLEEKKKVMIDHIPNLVEFSIPECYMILKERKLLTKNDSFLKLPNISISIPKPEDIYMYTRTEDSSLGITLKDFMSNISIDKLYKVWDKYLSDISYMNLDIQKLSRISSITNETDGDLVILYVMLSNLTNFIPDGVIASLELYTKAIISLLNVVKDSISMLLDNYEILMSNDIVIISGNKENILIFKHSYDKFLTDNGSIESIFGACLNDTDSVNIRLSTLVENNLVYLDNWNRYHQDRLLQNRLNSFRLFKLIYSDILSTYVKGISGDQLLMDTTSEFVNELNSVTIYNVNDNIKKYFSTIVYKNTNFKTFLEYVESYMKMDVSMTMDRAITYTVQEMISDYILTMLSVTDSTN